MRVSIWSHCKPVVDPWNPGSVQLCIFSGRGTFFGSFSWLYVNYISTRTVICTDRGYRVSAYTIHGSNQLRCPSPKRCHGRNLLRFTSEEGPSDTPFCYRLPSSMGPVVNFVLTHCVWTTSDITVVVWSEFFNVGSRTDQQD